MANIKKVKYLFIRFKDDMFAYEISALRGAIIDKVGRENDLFHNHLDDNKYKYSYPLIQYKCHRGKPALLCMHDGAEAIQEYFTKQNRKLNISGRELSMEVETINMNQYNLNVWDTLEKYQLTNWVALNQDTYKKYKALEENADRLPFLVKILIGNMLSFAKGLDWSVPRTIEVQGFQIIKEKWVTLKGIILICWQGIN